MIEINLLSVWIPTLLSVAWGIFMYQVYVKDTFYPTFRDLEISEICGILFGFSLIWNIWFVAREIFR